MEMKYGDEDEDEDEAEDEAEEKYEEKYEEEEETKPQYIQALPTGKFRYRKGRTDKSFKSLKEAIAFREIDIKDSNGPKQSFVDQRKSSIRISVQDLLSYYNKLTRKGWFELEDLSVFQEKLQRYEVLDKLPFETRATETLPVGWRYSYIFRSRFDTWIFRYKFMGTSQKWKSCKTLDKALDQRRFGFRYLHKRQARDDLPIGATREKYPILHFFNEEIAAYKPKNNFEEYKEAFDFFHAKLVHCQSIGKDDAILALSALSAAESAFIAKQGTLKARGGISV